MTEPLVLANARHPGLQAALARVLARWPRAVLLTDDVEALPALDDRVRAIEPEALLPHGVAEIDDVWDREVETLLRELLPGAVGEQPLSRLLWVNFLRQPRLIHRNYAVVVARRVIRELRPAEIWPVGPAPYHCDLILLAAERAEIPIVEPPAARLRRHAGTGGRTPVGILAAVSFLALNLGRLLARFPQRRAAARGLAAAGFDESHTAPVWFAVNPAFVQPMRHLQPVFDAYRRSGHAKFGILFYSAFGVKRLSGDRAIDELSIVRGDSPTAVGQVAAVTRVGDLLRLVGQWLPLSIRCVFAALESRDAATIAGMPALDPRDIVSLMRVATSDLLRVVEGHLATTRWLAAHPRARCVVFSMASFGEAKVADLAMQAAGLITADYAHGYVSEGNLRTTWRSHSTFHLAWTDEQAAQFRQLGTNRNNIGGCMPWTPVATPPRAGLPVVLVVSGYSWDEVFIQNLKYGRRLARAVATLQESLRGRATVRVRLHPLQDRATWTSHFEGGEAPPLSDTPLLGDDLAGADIVIATLSSAFIEALLYRVPILVHRGPPVERGSLFDQVPPERWFSAGAELVAKVESLLRTPRDTGPEERLIGLCFGETGAPRDVAAVLDQAASG